jgi:hypothetical protein
MGPQWATLSIGFIEIKVPPKLSHTTSKIGGLLYKANLETNYHSENRDLHEKLGSFCQEMVVALFWCVISDRRT